MTCSATRNWFVISSWLLCAAMIALLAGFSPVVADPAQDSDPMSAYYANTWDFSEEGDSKRLHINKDKSVKIRLSDGRVFDGTWTRDGETICFHVGNERACFSDLLGRTVGTTWTGLHDGEDYTGTLSEGRDPLN